ncbi:MAG: 1,4-dihydroxy-2-naphthoate octaprenyltransferase [Thermomicrobiales bacterium]|nr:1,4-dihydroxy-2-naphthoate octaprenyltransferase [Thermomicrobiales bacterium]
MTTAIGSSANISPLSAWLLAARPKTLPAAISPVLVGCAVAWAENGFDLVAALAAFAVALLLQIGANLANDVADFRRGAIAAAVTYTAGPKPFGYLGLGDLVVFVFFGPVAVVGTAFVMTHQVTRLALVASVAIGCLVTAILVVNNLRDIDTDRVAGKRTLAVRIGREATRREYTALIAVAYAMPLVMWTSGLTELGPLLAWATAPLAILLVRQVRNVDGRALNPVLGGTARLCLWFAVALGAGIVL